MFEPFGSHNNVNNPSGKLKYPAHMGFLST